MSQNRIRSINPGKITWKPGTILSPVPAALITCKGHEGRANIITVSWTGTICSEPPMLSISIRPERHSFQLIKETGEFVVNIPDRKIVKETDLCGVISGKDHDKFHETGLTQGACETLRVPLILECPINIECKVCQTIELGSHTMFLAKVTALQVAENLMDEHGKMRSEKAALVGYAHGNYYQLSRPIGSFGFSVKKH